MKTIASQPPAPGGSGDRPTWYDAFIDNPEASRDEDLRYPDDLGDTPYDRIHEIGDELRDAFQPYWAERVAEVEQNGGMVVRDKHQLTAEEQERYEGLSPEGKKLILDESDRQTAFEDDVRWAHHMLTDIFKIEERNPFSRIVVLYDVDEVIGKVPQSGEGWLKDLPELAGVNLLNPAPEDQALVREVTMRESAKRLILRPALQVVTNYLLNHLSYEEGRIQFGLLTSHNQEELQRYLLPRFQQMCPGAFSKENLISTIDSSIAMSVQKDVNARLQRLRRAILRENVTMRAAEAHLPEDQKSALKAVPETLSIAQFVDRYPHLRAAFDKSPETRRALEEGAIDRQGLKPFIAAEKIRRGSSRGRYGRTVVVNVDDWPIFKHVRNPDGHYQAIHVGTGQQYRYPGSSGHTNFEDIDALLAELGLDALE